MQDLLFHCISNKIKKGAACVGWQLLRIEKVHLIGNNNISFEGKYRSSDGSVGVEITVHYKENKWKSKERKGLGLVNYYCTNGALIQEELTRFSWM